MRPPISSLRRADDAEHATAAGEAAKPGKAPTPRVSLGKVGQPSSVYYVISKRSGENLFAKGQALVRGVCARRWSTSQRPPPRPAAGNAFGTSLRRPGRTFLVKFQSGQGVPLRSAFLSVSGLFS